MGALDPRLASGRRFLKANWDDIEGITTDQSAGVPVPAMEAPCPPGAATVELVPASRLSVGNLSVREAIARRRSRRAFDAGSLTLEELSYLLWATQGVGKLTPKWTLRTSPSAGARHPFETYLAVFRVDGVEPGLWRYQPLGHRLCRLPRRAEGMAAELDAALFEQLFGCAVAFLWTAVPYRTEWRYHAVSHKVILLDAGHLCQNLYLACESIGCGTCALGAYDQQGLDRFLGVDGEEEMAVYAAPVGRQKAAAGPEGPAGRASAGVS
jgi:SagB-type dehydrogenase family enzyme